MGVDQFTSEVALKTIINKFIVLQKIENHVYEGYKNYEKVVYEKAMDFRIFLHPYVLKYFESFGES